MINVFVGKLLNEKWYLPLLAPNFGPIFKPNRLFASKAIENFKEKIFNVVADINQANFVLLPHDYFYVTKTSQSFLAEYRALAKQSGKKLLIFDFSDFSERVINEPEAIIFRVAAYRSALQPNEMIMPPFVEDLSKYQPITLRSKNDQPIVGFCGFADLPDMISKIKFHVKNVLQRGPYRQGIYFRRLAMKFLENTASVKTNFIKRNFFSSHKKTVFLPPEQLRREYIENMMNSDLALIVKGDANFSFRFYEALSLGRVPVFVNTDCVLPLEDKIDYQKFVLFVDYQDLSQIGQRIKEFWNKISNEEFQAMQHLARQTFEQYLEIGAFLRRALSNLKES